MSKILSVTAARKLFVLTANEAINGAFTAEHAAKRGKTVARRVYRDVVEKPVNGDLDSLQLAARAGVDISDVSEPMHLDAE